MDPPVSNFPSLDGFFFVLIKQYLEPRSSCMEGKNLNIGLSLQTLVEFLAKQNKAELVSEARGSQKPGRI